MRAELLSYIRGLSLGNFRVDDNLPRTESGESLVLKNPRRIYVDNPQTVDTPIITALNGLNIYSSVTTVTVAFATDSKVLSANYLELVDAISAAKNINPQLGFNSRDVEVSSEYNNDLLVTEIEFSYTKLR